MGLAPRGKHRRTSLERVEAAAFYQSPSMRVARRSSGGGAGAVAAVGGRVKARAKRSLATRIAGRLSSLQTKK